MIQFPMPCMAAYNYNNIVLVVFGSCLPHLGY